jgi:hypothetical protein
MKKGSISPGEKCQLIMQRRKMIYTNVLYRGLVNKNGGSFPVEGYNNRLPHEFVARNDPILGDYVMFFKLRDNGFKVFEENDNRLIAPSKIIEPIPGIGGHMFYTGFYDTEVSNFDTIKISKGDLKAIFVELDEAGL